jgi:hypothetical protein
MIDHLKKKPKLPLSIFKIEKRLIKIDYNFDDTGVQSKNNEYHIVNKVENQGIYE